MHFITTTAPTHTRTETALSELFMLTQRRRAHLDTQTHETQTQSSGGASSTDWTHRRTWLVCFAPPEWNSSRTSIHPYTFRVMLTFLPFSFSRLVSVPFHAMNSVPLTHTIYEVIRVHLFSLPFLIRLITFAKCFSPWLPLLLWYN